MENYLVVKTGEVQFAADRAILTAFPYLDAVFRRQSHLEREAGTLDIQTLPLTPLQLHKNFHVLIPDRDLLLVCAWVTTRDVRPLLRANDDIAYWTRLSQYLGNTQIPRDLHREVARRKRGRPGRKCWRMVRRGWYRLCNIPVDRYRALKRAGFNGQSVQQTVAMLQALGFTPARMQQALVFGARLWFRVTVGFTVVLSMSILLIYHGQFIVTIIPLFLGLALHFAFSFFIAPFGSFMLTLVLALLPLITHGAQQTEYVTSVLHFMHGAAAYETALIDYVRSYANATI